ncbi:MAG: hypothetical protein R2821_01180 [Flavobacteriaceae bacterium]|jgi:hypothetical protein
MKKTKFLLLLFVLFFVSVAHAQKVEHEGKEYKVKGSKILLNDEDVTTQLTEEQQKEIKRKLKEKLDKEEKIKKAEKAQKKSEKKQKAAEKQQKKAEKEVKKHAKAQDNFSDAKKKYDKEFKKYQKLKSKGKLSPEDEVKWLKKLEGLQKKIDKTERKL